MAWTTATSGATVWAVSTASSSSWAVSSAVTGSWPQDLATLFYDDEDYYDSATDDYDRTREAWGVVASPTTTWQVTP